jgi:hypothetical protein
MNGGTRRVSEVAMIANKFPASDPVPPVSPGSISIKPIAGQALHSHNRFLNLLMLRLR